MSTSIFILLSAIVLCYGKPNPRNSYRSIVNSPVGFYAKMMSSCTSNAMFNCGNGQCVSGSRRCDGHSDCSNGNDENNCICSTGQFQCLNNQCISLTSKCDGHKDCHYNEDELNCAGCAPNYFQCATSGRCIPNSWVCDGFPDCDNDETNCSKESKESVMAQKVRNFIKYLKQNDILSQETYVNRRGRKYYD